MRNLAIAMMMMAAVGFPALCRDARAADAEGPAMGGIGVQAGVINDEFVVIQALPGTPAERAGIAPMDVILEVDSEPMTGQSVATFVSRMQGRIGTGVSLLLRHPDGTFQRLALQRGSLTGAAPAAEAAPRKAVKSAYAPPPPPPSVPAPAPQMAAPSAAQSLPSEDLARFNRTMSSGKPAQIYALAITMEQRGRADLASKLYTTLIDRYPDSPYTEKAINKMEAGTSAPPQRAAAMPPQMAPPMTPQTSYREQAIANCNASCSAQYAACQEQASNDNEDELVGGVTGALMGGGGGMLGGILSGQASSRATAGYLINKAAAGGQCDGSLRVCNAGCGG